MNGTEFVEAVGADEATALHRLGSDKYLVGATGADLSTPAVLRTVAAAAASGRDAFAAWADDESDPAAERFAAAAATESEAYERATDALATATGADDAPAVDPDGAVGRALRSADDAVERAGAMVGRGLVGDRTRLQVVNFFVNEGDARRADLARDLRTDATDQVEAGADLLEGLCEGDGDWDRAREAASAVVAAAYDEYAERLESMGVDPKPVC